MLYKKSPFDLVYERGDSVALAVISGKIYFPPNSSEVIILRVNITIFKNCYVLFLILLNVCLFSRMSTI